MFLFHAINEASSTLPHNAVDVDDVADASAKYKIIGRPGSAAHITFNARINSEHSRIKRALNKSMKRPTKNVAAYLNR